MISNYVLREKLDRLKKEKSVLSNEMAELRKSISDTGITKQAIWKQKKGLHDKIDEDQFNLRQVYAKRIVEVEKEFIRVNAEIRECLKVQDSETNLSLLRVFEEIFTPEQLLEITTESKRRMEGGHPFKLSFNVAESVEVKEAMRKYKKQIIEQLDTMVKFRMELTNLIDKGCEQFGKAEFLTFISPLNRLITPTSELEKTKRKIIG